MNLSDLTPDPNNANKGTERGNSALEASLQQYGAGRSILLDKNDTIIAGNKTAEMAGQLGMMNVKVVETTGDELVAVKRTDLDLETDASAREMAYADNRTSELSLDWDADALLNDIENGIDVSKFFSDNEVDKLLGPKPTEDVPAPDATAELQEKWGTEREQVWEIGRHRLMCGDSTSAEDVTTLLEGNKPNLMVTDPPYGVEYDADWRNHALREDGSTIGGRATGKVQNDDRADWRESCANFPGNVAYVWHAGNKANISADSLIATGLDIRAQIIWAKNNIVIGRGDYHPKHEPCWYCVRKGKPGNYNGGRKQTTVWEIDKPQKSETGHSTQKPLECMARPIRNHEGDVYDPFLGSGTTMVAAESLDRTCYGMEIDPGYCAVILERMSGMGLEGTIAV